MLQLSGEKNTTILETVKKQCKAKSDPVPEKKHKINTGFPIYQSGFLTENLTQRASAAQGINRFMYLQSAGMGEP